MKDDLDFSTKVLNKNVKDLFHAKKIPITHDEQKIWTNVMLSKPIPKKDTLRKEIEEALSTVRRKMEYESFELEVDEAVDKLLTLFKREKIKWTGKPISEQMKQIQEEWYKKHK